MVKFLPTLTSFSSLHSDSLDRLGTYIILPSTCPRLAIYSAGNWELFEIVPLSPLIRTTPAMLCAAYFILCGSLDIVQTNVFLALSVVQVVRRYGRDPGGVASAGAECETVNLRV